MVSPWVVSRRLQPCLNAFAGFVGSTLKMRQIGNSVAVAGLPLVFAVLVAKLEGGGAERAFRTLVFPNTRLDGAFTKPFNRRLAAVAAWFGFITGFLAWSSRLRQKRLHG